MQIGGYQRGGQVELTPEVQKMIAHQIKMGELSEGMTAYVKFAGDGTQISKRDTVTAHTVTLSNNTKALQIGSISLYLGGEQYHVSKS